MTSSTISFDGVLDEPQTISFAPNMTEATFRLEEDEPDCSESDLLFPPMDSDATDPEGGLPARRAYHGRKKDSAHIPRPPNAFILFRSSFIKQQHIPGSIEGNHSQLSKIVGACWQRLSFEEKLVWEKKAKAARAEHKRMYPDYKFVRTKNDSKKVVDKMKQKPPAKFVNTIAVAEPSDSSDAGSKTMVMQTQSPTKAARRRGPAKSPESQRPEHIARLLVAGHKGSSLEAMVQKFDADAEQQRKVVAAAEQNGLAARPVNRIVRGSVAQAQLLRRTSSCPPIELPIQGRFRVDSPRSRLSKAPCPRPKPLRVASTMPYPQVFPKVSRSVSPPTSPPYHELIHPTPITPIEGPFAHSTFNFISQSTSVTSPVQVHTVAPHDMRFCNLPSPTGTITESTWSPNGPVASPIEDVSIFDSFSTRVSMELPQPYPNAFLSQTSTAGVTALSPITPTESWSSDFEWMFSSNTEDETGSSTAPPSTPGMSSPVIHYPGLPLEEVVVHDGAYTVDHSTTSQTVDLSNYTKGLEYFTQDVSVFPTGTPTADAYAVHPLDGIQHPYPADSAGNPLSPMERGLQHPDSPEIWTLHSYMNSPTPGDMGYHY